MAYIFKILLILFDNNVVNMVDFSETRHISLPIKGGFRPITLEKGISS